MEIALFGISSEKYERVVVFRIKEGQDLLNAIEEGVRRENIKTGVFLTGLGALKEGVFRNLKKFPDKYPVKKEDRVYYKVKKPMELVSLVGWIGTKADGCPEIHAHFSASTLEGEKAVVTGGHLDKGTITGIKCVVAIGVISSENIRVDFDDETLTEDLFF